MIIKFFDLSIYGVNTYVITDEDTKRSVIIDPCGKISQLANYIQEEDLIIDTIILTHGHGDHIGLVNEIRDKYNCKMIAHAMEKTLLNDASYNLSTAVGIGSVELEADQYVHDMEKYQLGNTVLQFIHTPGHTKGSMCIEVEDSLFTGDTLFKGSIGRTDLYSGNEKDMKKSLEYLAGFDFNYKIFPGHGPSSTLQIEKDTNPFLKAFN